jgi:hypothetical protein
MRNLGYVILDYAPGEDDPWQVSDWYASRDAAVADACGIAVQSEMLGHGKRLYLVCRCIPVDAGLALNDE